MIENFTLIAGGLILLFIGGEALVRSSVALAQRFSVSSLLVSFVIVGFGTSMPELVVSIEAVILGSSDIAVGNIVGSNIANVLLVLGLAALICPIHCNVKTVWRNSTVMLLSSFLLVGLATVSIVETWMGFAMVFAMISYIGYSYWAEKSQTNFVSDLKKTGLSRA